MTDPKRREKPKPHLDASLVPVERALLARAEHLDALAAKDHPIDADKVMASIFQEMSVEFRALAEELHHW